MINQTKLEEEMNMSFKLDEVLRDIRIEHNKAISKYSKFASTHEGYAVIHEELDELWDLVKRNKGVLGNEEMRKEAIQVAAMAIRFISDLC
jgi:hypothetical protein